MKICHKTTKNGRCFKQDLGKKEKCIRVKSKKELFKNFILLHLNQNVCDIKIKK